MAATAVTLNDFQGHPSAVKSLPNETRYRQPVKCVDNFEGSATSPQNDVNFGPQTASNWKLVFTHPA